MAALLVFWQIADCAQIVPVAVVAGDLRLNPILLGACLSSSGPTML